MAEGDSNFSGSPTAKVRNPKQLRKLSGMRELKSRALPSYFEVKSKETILNALEVIETDVRLGKPIHWNVLLSVVRAMTLDGETAFHCLKFVRELFSLFERHQCRDVNLISEVFLVTHFLTSFDVKLKDRDKSMEIRNTFYLPYGEETILFKGMDLVYNSARFANLALLKLQLKFGMGMMTPFVTADTCSNHFCKLLKNWVQQDHNFLINVRRVSKTCKKLCSVLNLESRKRLWLVSRVLEIVRTIRAENQGDREDFAECYSLLFDSIPEAYVTSIEVKAYLQKCLPRRWPTLISQITEEFKRLLPELAEVPQPRSLQHLRRIQVRQCLRQNLNLPHGVSSLPLPTLLKEYIMLQDNVNYNMKIKTVIDIHGRDDCITSFLKSL